MQAAGSLQQSTLSAPTQYSRSRHSVRCIRARKAPTTQIGPAHPARPATHPEGLRPLMRPATLPTRQTRGLGPWTPYRHCHVHRAPLPQSGRCPRSRPAPQPPPPPAAPVPALAPPAHSKAGMFTITSAPRAAAARACPP